MPSHTHLHARLGCLGGLEGLQQQPVLLHHLLKGSHLCCRQRLLVQCALGSSARHARVQGCWE